MKIKPTAITGLHVGTDWVRLVKTGSDGRIRKYGSARLPDGISPAERDKYLKAVIEAIAKAAFEGNIPGGPVALALGGPEVIVRRFFLPVLPPQALMRNVRFEISPFLALSVEDYALSYKVCGQENRGGSDVLSILAVAAPRELPFDLADCARAVGFAPRYADSVETARDKLFRYLAPKGSPELANAVVMDINADYAHVSTYLAGRFTFNRYIPVSGPYEDTRDRLASELAAMLDYAYYAGARGAAGTLYIVGNNALISPETCGFLSDFLGVKVRPLSDALRPLCPDDEQALYVDALAATIREVN